MKPLKLMKIQGLTVKIRHSGCNHFPYEWKIRLPKNWQLWERTGCKREWLYDPTSSGHLGSCIQKAKDVVNFYLKNQPPKGRTLIYRQRKVRPN